MAHEFSRDFSISLIEHLTPSISCTSSHLRVDTSVCKLLKLSSILFSIALNLSKMTFKGRGESVSTSMSISPRFRFGVDCEFELELDERSARFDIQTRG